MDPDYDRARVTETERYDNEEIMNRSLAIMLRNSCKVQLPQLLPNGRYEIVFRLGAERVPPLLACTTRPYGPSCQLRLIGGGERFDVTRLGMGPGGEVAAAKLPMVGKKIVVIERELDDGECDYWAACIPFRTLAHPLEVRARAVKRRRHWLQRHLRSLSRVLPSFRAASLLHRMHTTASLSLIPGPPILRLAPLQQTLTGRLKRVEPSDTAWEEIGGHRIGGEGESASGRDRWKVLPAPTSDSSQILPPCLSAIVLLMYSPNPSPP